MPFTQQGYYLNENAPHSSFRERKPAPRMNFATFAPPPRGRQVHLRRQREERARRDRRVPPATAPGSTIPSALPVIESDPAQLEPGDSSPVCFRSDQVEVAHCQFDRNRSPESAPPADPAPPSRDTVTGLPRQV